MEVSNERVAEWWSSYAVRGTPSFLLAKKLKPRKQDLKKLEREEFGRLEHKKVMLIGKNQIIDKIVQEESFWKKNMSLESRRKKILEGLQTWKKSRHLWLQNGDRNTRFFYSGGFFIAESYGVTVTPWSCDYVLNFDFKGFAAMTTTELCGGSLYVRFMGSDTKDC